MSTFRLFKFETLYCENETWGLKSANLEGNVISDCENKDCTFIDQHMKVS